MLIKVILIYLVVGLLIIGIAELVRKIISTSITIAATETQSRLLRRGQPVGTKTSVVITLLAVWLAWPALLYGVIESALHGEHHIEEGKRNK